MYVQISTIVFFCLLIGNVSAADQAVLNDEADRINYSIGHQIGSDFRRQKVMLNEQALRQGLQHGQAGETPLIGKAEMKEALLELKRNITNKMKKDAEARISSRKQIEDKKRSDGKTFMLKNQAREGVKTLPNGVQYKVIKKGAGLKPKQDDFVTFDYRARTMGGREYDSSLKKGGPVTYRANSVLPGFTEVVQLMQPGARWELYLPPEQAYGRQGPLAHETIILEVELLSIGQ